MSTSPGVTYNPETSTTLNAAAESRRAATAATLPSAIATSRTALIRFLGSMTWPPFRSRSYFCCAGAWPIDASTKQAPAANAIVSSLIASPPTVLVPPCRPFPRQVLAHVERARHSVGGDGAAEPEAQRVAIALG